MNSDRFNAALGIMLLLFLVAASYYYAVLAEKDSLTAPTSPQSPDFTADKITMTEFNEQGWAFRRVYAEHTEHYEDGRMTAVKPRLVTLLPSEPQLNASADYGETLDGGETAFFKGNVRVTRAGDAERPPLTFTTTHMTIFPDTSRLETDAPVYMKSGIDTTTGVGLTLDNVERTVDIHSKVRTVSMPRNENSTPRRKK